MLKYWNSNLYAPAARVIGVYSQRLSREILEWSKQDVAQANLLQQHVFSLAAQDGLGGGTYNVAPAKSVTLAGPQIKQPKPDAAEDAALDALDMIGASEQSCAGLIDGAAKDPLLKHLHALVDLAVLAEVSRMRERETRQMGEMIRAGSLWESEKPRFWHCLKCVAYTHGKIAFQECPGCKAGRAYATVGGW